MRLAFADYRRRRSRIAFRTWLILTTLTCLSLEFDCGDSPYDLDARPGVKRETAWQGYKVHLTETVDPEGPQLITDAQTDFAPATDR